MTRIQLARAKVRGRQQGKLQLKFQPDRFSPRGDKREEEEGGGGEETNSGYERLNGPLACGGRGPKNMPAKRA